jgi:hypothetical protein
MSRLDRHARAVPSGSVTQPQVENPVMEALSGEGAAVWIIGAPGAGATALARTAAARLGRTCAQVRLLGCESADDIVLALGHAAGAIPAGDEGALGNVLRSRDDALVFLDEADVPGIEEVWGALRTLAPRLRWLFTGYRCPLPEDQVRVLRLGGGEPVIAPLVSNPELDLLALLPAGLPARGEVPAALLAVDGARRALRRGVLSSLVGRVEGQVGALSMRLALRYEALLEVAQGGPFPADLSHQDLLAMRFIAERSPDVALACQAAAVAGRLCSSWGQPQEGRALLDAALRRHPQAPPAGRAVILAAQAEGSVLIGDLDDAHDIATRAVAVAAEGGALSLAATLAARWASRLSSLGARGLAPQAWRDARARFREVEEPAGLSVALRGSADQAVAMGELVGAETLYEQAACTPATPIEQANRLLGVAALALTQSNLASAHQSLRAVEPLAAGVPLLEANLLRRRAELLLRQGAAASAFLSAFDARARYASIGELVAAAHTTRLLGDITADQGEGGAARRWYKEAVDLQLRIHDRVGLRRTLRHLAALETEAGNLDLVAQIAQDVQDLSEDLP